MNYKVMIGDQLYKIAMSDEANYTPKDDRDIIVYTVDMENQVINARIENPSQHTLYLIDQGRCFITINCRNFIGHSGEGSHTYGEWDPNDPRKTNPDWWGMSHSSGLGRGSYRFHKHWSLCLGGDYSLLNSNNGPIKVTDITNIEIPIHFRLNRNYGWMNVKGYRALQKVSDTYESPYRDEFYFDIRLALLTTNQVDTSQWIDSSRMRVYQTKSKITRITFER